MQFASEHISWSSYPVNDVPSQWGTVIGHGNIRLCDEGVDAYPNALVAPNMFWFFFPRLPCPDRPWEHELVQTIEHHMIECLPLVVHLFSNRPTPEYYGIWSPVFMRCIDDRTRMLTLIRLENQTLTSSVAPRLQRPFHVRAHEHFLRQNMPRGWSLCHPESFEPQVVCGKRRGVPSSSCDLVLAHGCCRRICIVSCPSRHVSESVWTHCIHLKQRMMCRVVILYGSLPTFECWDFGSPDDGGDPKHYQNVEWLETLTDHD